METRLLTYSTSKRLCIVAFTAAVIAIPVANWLIDSDDFNRRFLGETKWDLSIYFFGLAWLIYAATWPALSSWKLVGSWQLQGRRLISPDEHAWELADFRGARSESHWLRHPTIRLVGEGTRDVEIPTGFRSSEDVEEVVLTLNNAIQRARDS